MPDIDTNIDNHAILFPVPTQMTQEKQVENTAIANRII